MANYTLSKSEPRIGNGNAIPEFLKIVVAEENPAARHVVAEQAVLALNSSMMQLYEESLLKFGHTLRERAPIILALFTGAGGQMILYRPGHPPEVAPPVPIVYQLAKSVGHSTMAIYQVVVPYLANPKANQLWRGRLESFQLQNQLALESLGDLNISDEDREVLSAILVRNLAFMKDCLAAGTFTYESVEKFIRDCAPHSVKTIGIGSTAQVRHWMSVVEEWKNRLGSDWDKTYAVSNSLYVARQNNILFSVLAQFLGTETMGDRLLLIETPDFETTPDKMLEVLTRIVADRALGMVFFKDYFLMDVELLGGGGRKAIEQEMSKRGQKALLPTLARFRSNDWPWKTDPTKGTGPSRLEEIN